MTDQLPTGWKLDRPTTTQDDPASAALSAAPSMPTGWKLDRPGAAPTQALTAAEEPGDFARGFKSTLPQLKQLGGGALAFVGEGIKRAGADQVGQSIKDYGLGVYADNEKKVQALSKPSDSFSNVMEGKGNAVDFLQYGAGYTAGQALESVASAAVGAGIGAAAGSVVPVAGNAAGGVGGAVTGLVAKAAVKKGLKEAMTSLFEKELGEQLAKGATREVAEAAAKKAASGLERKAFETGARNIGAAAGTGAFNLVQEAGSIYPEAEHKAQQEGRELSGNELVKAGAASLGAAGVETITDLFNVGKIIGGTQGLQVIKRVLSEGLKGAGREGATEALQTAIERWGSGSEIASAEGLRDIVDSAALGAVGGGLAGGIAGVHAAPEQKRNEPLPEVQPTPDVPGIPLPTLALPAPAPITVDAQGNAITPTQADAAARADAQGVQQREVLGLTPDVNAARIAHPGAIPNAEPRAVPFPTAAPGSMASAANVIASTAPPASRPIIEGESTRVPAVPQDLTGIVDYLTKQGLANGRPPAVSEIAKAYGLQPDQARALRKQAIAGMAPAPAPEATQSGELFDAAASPAEEVNAPGSDPQLAALQRQLETDRAELDQVGASDAPNYDNSTEVLDSDITPPSGGAFSDRQAAELQAKRHDGGKVVEVDGGFVVRTPAAVESDAASMNTDHAADRAPPVAPASQSETGQDQASTDVPAAAAPQSEPALAQPPVVPSDQQSSLAQATPDVGAVQAAADTAATSHANDLPHPTEAQKDAGNYQKGHVRVAGMDVAIENPAGSRRRPEWPPLKHHYGYIKGTIGKDKDHVDVFLTPQAEDAKRPVFVVDQNTQDGKFDEHKVIMGAADEDEARKAYLDNYSKGWKGLGAITQMTQAEFKKWVADPAETRRPAFRAQAADAKAATMTQALASAPNPERDAALRRATDAIGQIGNPKQNGAPFKTAKSANTLLKSLPNATDYDVYGVGDGYVLRPVSKDNGVGALDARWTDQAAHKARKSANARDYEARGGIPTAEPSSKATAADKGTSTQPTKQPPAPTNNDHKKAETEAIAKAAQALQTGAKTITLTGKGNGMPAAQVSVGQDDSGKWRYSASFNDAGNGMMAPWSRERFDSEDAALSDGLNLILQRLPRAKSDQTAGITAIRKFVANHMPAQPDPDSNNEKAPAAPPAPVSTPAPTATIVDAARQALTAAGDGTATLAELRAAFLQVRDGKDAVVAELNKMTKDQLRREFRSMRADSKPELVSDAYRSLLSGFTLHTMLSFQIHGDYQASHLAAVQKAVDALTDADLAAYAKERGESRAKFDAKLAGIDDPKTVEDFARRSQLLGGESKLTPEQRATFDALRTEARREQREAEAKRNAVVRQVDTGTTGMSLVETKHTRDGHDLFVVQMAERVDGEVYNSLNAAAKKLGGHYSSYRGHGAVPGFTFRSRDAAEQFMAVREGNVDASAQQQARSEAKADARSESLADKAEAVRSRAQASLNQDRKDNTARRARMASSAEDEARKQLALADTMSALAKAIEAGTARLLAFVRHKSQVQLLDQLLRNAHWERQRAQGVNWEKAKEAPITAESVTSAMLPSFHLSRGDAALVARRLQAARGGKALGVALAKQVDYGDEYGAAVQDNPLRFLVGKSSGGLAYFARKRDADAALARSPDKLRGVVVKMPRAGKTSNSSQDWAVALAPELAIERKLWAPDCDKKIALSPKFAEKVMSTLGVGTAGDNSVPYWWASHLEERNRLAKLGIETSYELREALREYLALRKTPAGEDTVRKLERALAGKTEVGIDFFPTPPAVVSRMVEQADVGPGMHVLEPSAGKGDIAEALRDAAADVQVDTVEMSHTLRELLEAKGFDPVGADFLQHQPEQRYDRIVMNPPFGNDNGASHVRHAYSLLKPGGRIVAVMGAGTRGKAAFETWLESVGGLSEPLPDGSFKSSFRPTGVSTVMVVIDHAEEAGSRLRRSDAPVARGAFDVDATVAGITASWKSGPKVQVVDQASDLPADIVREYQRYGSDGGDVRGVYHLGSKTIFVVRANARTRQDVETTLFHEAYGHHGLRLMFGADTDRQIQRLLNAVGGVRGLQAYALRNDIDLGPYAAILRRPNLTRDQQAGVLFDELFAHMAERIDTLPTNLAQKVRELIGAIRHWLRSNGFETLAGSLTDGEVAHLLNRSRRAVQGDPRALAGATTGDPKFSKDASPKPFYSALSEAVAGGKGAPKRGTAVQWSQWLDGAQRRGEFKQEERDWMGVDAWLREAGAVTRDQVADFIRANEVSVQETTLAPPDTEAGLKLVQQAETVITDAGLNSDVDGDGEWRVYDADGEPVVPADMPPQVRAALDRLQASESDRGGEVRFAGYQLPGGDNYRELLLTLPMTTAPEFDASKVEIRRKRASTTQGTAELFYDGEKLAGPYSDEGSVQENWRKPDEYWMAAAQRLFNYGSRLPDGREQVKSRRGGYRSSHFDQPNILAHVRFNERTDADGKRVLFLEEVQSDWHQAGRKNGYKPSGPSFQNFNEWASNRGIPAWKADELWDQQRNLSGDDAATWLAWQRDLRAMASDIPDAPFKTTWPMLAFKRMVRYAAEHGFDRIAFTTGEQQAKRYDLSKHISKLQLTVTSGGAYTPKDGPFKGGTVSAWGLDGKGLIANQYVSSEEDLAEKVGKEAAKKLLEQKPEAGSSAGLGALKRTLEGLDLKIGGEGMKGFYDQILPSAINKWGKRFGVKVEAANIQTGQRKSFEEFSREDEAAFGPSSDENRRARYDDLGFGRFVGFESHSLELTPAMRDAAMAGQPLFRRAADIASAAFKRWFGDSKVVNADGSPRVVYHGTAAEFWTFDKERLADSTGHMSAPLGFFFAEDRAKSERYAAKAADGVPADERVVDVYLTIAKPKTMTVDALMEIDSQAEAVALRESLQKQGFDGIHIADIGQWIAFENTQIKSASENSGAFDGTNPDIRFALGKKQGPVALSSSELPAPAETGGLRAAVREATRTRMADKTVTTANGDAVMIPWQGLKKASQNADKRAMVALLRIDELLTASHLANTSPDNKGRDNMVAVHDYVADATLDGEPVQVRMIVREATDGRRFYDHAVIERKEPVGIPGKTTPKGDASAQPATGSSENVRPAEDTGNPDPDIRFSFKAPTNPTTADVQVPGEIKLSRSAFSSVKDWLGAIGKGKLTDLRPAMLSSIPLNHIVDFAKKGMSGVGHYVDLQYQMQAYRNGLYRDYDTLAQDWLAFGTQGTGIGGLLGRKVNQAGRDLADLMHDSTIASVDPTLAASEYAKDPDKARLHRELSARYAALPEAGQKLYTGVRDAYGRQVRLLEQTLEGNLNRAMEINRARSDRKYTDTLARIDESGDTDAEKAQARAVAGEKHDKALKASNHGAASKIIGLRQKFEAMRVEAPYFPLKRFGQYFVAVRDTAGRMVGFSKFETSAEQTAFAEQIRAQGLDARAGLDADKDAVRDSIDPRFVAEIEQILSGADMPEFIKDEVWQAYLEHLPDMSLRKSFIHRKKVAGYNPDALRAFSSTMFHGSYQLARLKYGMELGEALDLSEEQAKRNAPVEGMQLVNELRKRHEFIMNPKGGVAAQVATTAAFVFHLGANPAHLFLNATQTAMIGIPVLGARYGFGRTTSALQKAVGDFARGKGHIEKANLTADEQAAMAAFMDAGLIDKTQAHDLAGVGETGVEYSAVRQKVMNKLGWFFHQSERFNREVTSLAAYRLARQGGDSHAAAVQRAMRDTYTIHFDYSAAARARWMQSDTAKVLLVFRNYNVNMLYRLFRDIHQSFRGDSPQIRREARKQLGAMMGMYALMAGTMGVPFYGLAMVLAGMFEDDDDPLTAEQQFLQGAVELLGPDVARVLLRGVPGAVLDIDLTDRIGMPNLWFRSPDRELEGKDAYYFWMEQLLGAAPGLAKNVFDGLNLMNEGKIERGVEKMLPSFLRSPLRAARFANDGGANTLNGDKIADVGTGGLIAQALGYTPLELTEQYDTNSMLKGADSKLQRRRNSLLDRYFMAAQHGDGDGMADASAAIGAFNAKNPTYAITRKTMQRSEKMRERNRLMNKDGIVMTRRMQALSDQVTGKE